MTLTEEPRYQDSHGVRIVVGCTVRFRRELYTIKEFVPGEGRLNTARIVFNEPQHTEEPADELSVDIVVHR